ncbi:MAG: hypothetical protein AB8G05_06065 [Oligoflexales bacterium]
MMSTIRTGARLFKFGKSQVRKLKQKIPAFIRTVKSSCTQLIHKLKAKLKFVFFRYKPRQEKWVILLPFKAGNHAAAELQNSKPKPKSNKGLVSRKLRKRIKKKNKQVSKLKHQTPEVTQLHLQKPLKETIQEFYAEWEASYGPALNPLDREFLESARPELANKIMTNGRLTLKSPYLKAVYNGLRDLEDISDLLENDKEAKKKVLSLFQDYFDRGPDVFYKMLDIFHDKGSFPTRSGERRLSLDTRIMPDWLGLVG